MPNTQTPRLKLADPDSAVDQRWAPLDRLRRFIPGVVLTIPSGQTVALEGDAEGQVIGVLSGLLRCFKLTSDGRRYICRFAAPGSIVGLGAAKGQRHSAETITSSRLIVFRTAAIEAAMHRDPGVRAAVIQALAEELSEGERLQLRLGRRSADQRVADFLLELAGTESDDVSLCIPMSRADMADHLGVTIETVSRALHRFHRLGLIKLETHHHFRTLSRNGLKDFIEGEDSPFHVRKSPCQRHGEA